MPGSVGHDESGVPTTPAGEVCDGVVVEMLPRALCVVQLDSRRQVVAHLSTAPRRNFVRIMPGDRVTVELSRRDRTRGRITSRVG